METVSIQLSGTLLVALHKEPDEFVQEMRIAAAVKWYEMGEISQGQAEEIAGINSSEFTEALSRYQVSPEPQTKLSLKQIAALPVEQRHRLLAPSIATTAEDFFKDPGLTEFSVLDGEDWDTGND